MKNKKEVKENKKISKTGRYIPGMPSLVWNTMPIEYCKVEVLRPQQGSIFLEFRDRTVNDIGSAVIALTNVFFMGHEIGRFATKEEIKNWGLENETIIRKL